MSRHSTRLFPFAAALLLCMPLIACKPANPNTSSAPTAAAGATTTTADAKLDPVLADPKVGDLYAAELTHFSAYDFEGAEKAEKLFGLMKVTAVTSDTITAITENASWPEKKGALQDLRGDLADITWDDSEKISITRAELAKLIADGKIIEARRLQAQ